MEKRKEKIKDGETEIKKIPLGIKIIAVIYYIATVFYLGIALISFFKSGLISKIPDFATIITPRISILFGITFLLLSILSFFIARGLFKFQKWARIVLIIFSVVNIIGGIFSIIEGNLTSSINLVFNLVIASYLLFNKKVKSAFSN